MNRREGSKGKRSGMALFLVLVQIFILALIIGALGTLATRNLRATSEKSWERQARFAAYAGIQNSLAELENDHLFEAITPLERQLSEDGFLRYTFEVRNNVLSGDGSAELAPDNTWIPPGSAWVRSHGYLAEVGSYETAALIALVSRARPEFNHALFAEESLQIQGGTEVRAYSSKQGFAASASSPSAPKTLAHVGTNSKAPGAIQLASSAWIDGNAFSGLGSVPGSVISGSSHTGSSLQLEEAKEVYKFRTLQPASTVGYQIPQLNSALTHWIFPWETDPEAHSGNANLPREQSYGNYVIRTNNPDWSRATNLFAGEYFVNGDLTFRSDFSTFVESAVGGATKIPLHANDEFPVIFYVSGDITLDNVQVNNTGANGNDPVPRRLQFYMLTEGSTFRMTNGSIAHAVVAGKGVNVVLEGDSELFGAVIARNITVNNSDVNYDTDLFGIPLDGRTAWDILALKEASVAEATQEVGDPNATDDPPPSVHTLALDAVRGTRAPGNFDPNHPGGTPTEVPRDEIEPPPPPPPPPGEPGDPACGTCAGDGVGGGLTCADAPQCPGHGVCGECGFAAACSQVPCGGCGSYYVGQMNCPGGMNHVI